MLAANKKTSRHYIPSSRDVWQTISNLFILLIIGKLIDVMAMSCHPTYYKKSQCVNLPDGYSCQCEPGFTWNSRFCVANSLDSVFKFADSNATLSSPSYVWLTNRAFPPLDSITLSLWVRVSSRGHSGAVVSYTTQSDGSVFQITSGPTVGYTLFGHTAVTDVQLIPSHWTHVVFTWSSSDGVIRAYINGVRVPVNKTMSTKPIGVGRQIPEGGQLILGQSMKYGQRSDEILQQTSSGDQSMFDERLGFIGELGFFNVWRSSLTSSDVSLLHADCSLIYCGDVIEWADFRNGRTRGWLRVLWPSRIFTDPKNNTAIQKSCLTEENATSSCEKYCVQVHGAKCPEEIVANIRWPRTAVDTLVYVNCPDSDNNSTGTVHRRCEKVPGNSGVWSAPALNDCISSPELELKQQVTGLLKVVPVKADLVLESLSAIELRVGLQHYTKIVDMSTLIECIEMTVSSQEVMVDDFAKIQSSHTFGINRVYDRQLFPTWNQTNIFAQKIAKVFDRLLDESNDIAWLRSLPSGATGVALVKLIDRTLDVLAKSMNFLVSRGELTRQTPVSITASHENIEFAVEKLNWTHRKFVIFPRSAVTPDDSFSSSFVNISLNDLFGNTWGKPEYILMSMGRFRATQMLPTLSSVIEEKEDKLNSLALTVRFHDQHEHDSRITKVFSGKRPVFPAESYPSANDVLRAANVDIFPIVVTFNYEDNTNISNPGCARLLHQSRSADWSWTVEDSTCILDTQLTNPSVAVCQCSQPGTFGVVSDMYDITWTPPEEPLRLVALPTYIGCISSGFACFMSCLTLLYFRTSSNSAMLHKNFSLAITAGQLTYMVGLEKIKHTTLCHVMSVVLHYFFLAIFLWLMNEAFNLYMVITYAAHSRGEQTDGGAQWRFYILGWIMPGVIVGTLVGVYSTDYYASNMCWMSWKYVWILVGPVISITVVTVLVLIITAKEHHESSYSKNKRTNESIGVYSKALWTQTILLSACWFFAILSLNIKDDIVKWLHALFSVLQGLFFVIFYTLLNDELRTVCRKACKSLLTPEEEPDAKGTMMVEQVPTEANVETTNSSLITNQPVPYVTTSVLQTATSSMVVTTV